MDSMEYVITANRIELFEKVCQKLLSDTDMYCRRSACLIRILQAVLLNELILSKIKGNSILYYLKVSHDLHEILQVIDVASIRCLNVDLIAERCIGFID